jgi:hypothetical protein
VEQHPEYAYVGLNVADEPGTARSFLQENGWDWPQILDPERERARRLGADYQPHVVVLDPDGEIVARHEGGGTPPEWAALVQAVEAQRGG